MIYACNSHHVWVSHLLMSSCIFNVQYEKNRTTEVLFCPLYCGAILVTNLHKIVELGAKNEILVSANRLAYCKRRAYSQRTPPVS